MKFQVKKKGQDGKWFTFGNVKENQYGNHQLGMKVTPQLIKLMTDAKEGEWVNFSLFEPKEETA